MAKVYSKNNELKEEYLKVKELRKKSFIAVAICFTVFAANVCLFRIENSIVMFSCFMVFMISGAFAAYNHQKFEKLESGVKGEADTVEFLRELPDDYCIISNAKITFDGRTSKLDNIVVCPNGVFVIETKNHNGTITGNHRDTQLIQHKVGQGGTPYTSQLYNPIKQVATHVYRLSKILKERGIDIWVQGMVYFSNPSVEVDVEYDFYETPIFAKPVGGDRELCSYIMEYKGKKTLTQDNINNIVKELNK